MRERRALTRLSVSQHTAQQIDGSGFQFNERSAPGAGSLPKTPEY